MLRANPIFSVMHVHCRFDRLCILDRRTSPAPMPATVMAKEGAGLGIVGAITLGAGSGLAAFHRCISLAGRKWGRGQRGFRRGRASVQNVRIGIVECDRARLLNGCLGEYWCQCHRRQKRCRDKSLNKVMVGFLYRQMREFSGAAAITVRRPDVLSGARASHLPASECSDASS